MTIIAQLANLSGAPVVVGLIITASIIAIVRDWRFGLWALLVQYVLLGVLHLRMLPPELALIKVLVGLLICPMIYWSARWVESERAHKAEIERQKITREQGQVPLPPLPWPLRPTSGMFRLLVVLLLGMVLYSMSTWPLPLIAADLAPACVWLGLMGLLTLVLTANPLPAGLGLLTLVSGFELYFDVTQPGLAGIGVLAAINLSLGLVIAYLITVDALTGEVL